MTVGDRIHAVDGKGHAFECEITDADPRKTEVSIISKTDETRHWIPRITVAVAPTKNIDRMEWLLEKGTEIGVDRIIFLKCARSERKDVKPERLQKIIVSAMKQSMKAVLPDFEGMMDFKEFIRQLKDNGDNDIRIMGYCSDNFPRKELTGIYRQNEDVTLLIGPEGDFSPDEVKMATDAGFIPATFGNTRMRTETAAIYALSSIHVINNINNAL